MRSYEDSIQRLGFSKIDLLVIHDLDFHYHKTEENVQNFIKDLEDQFETVIGERGLKLSGGQRQRICIARAIYKDPPILIFDEATSSLDSESENSVQIAIEEVMKDRTSIIIAHRLSTIKNVDKIIVIDKGKIIEMGKHDELIKSNKIYSRLIEMQNIR